MERFRSIILTATAVGFLATVAAAQGHKGHEESTSPEGSPQPKAEPMLILKDQILPLRVTVTGKVVDVSCFLRHPAFSVDHDVCASLCVAQGLPMGILDAKAGQIYLIFAQGHHNPAETMAKHIGLVIKATGRSYSYGGLKGIEVQKVEVVEDQAENQLGGKRRAMRHGGGRMKRGLVLVAATALTVLFAASAGLAQMGCGMMGGGEHGGHNKGEAHETHGKASSMDCLEAQADSG